MGNEGWIVDTLTVPSALPVKSLVSLASCVIVVTSDSPWAFLNYPGNNIDKFICHRMPIPHVNGIPHQSLYAKPYHTTYYKPHDGITYHTTTMRTIPNAIPCHKTMPDIKQLSKTYQIKTLYIPHHTMRRTTPYRTPQHHYYVIYHTCLTFWPVSIIHIVTTEPTQALTT